MPALAQQFQPTPDDCTLAAETHEEAEKAGLGFKLPTSEGGVFPSREHVIKLTGSEVSTCHFCVVKSKRSEAECSC
jgi:hypothetical protein